MRKDDPSLFLAQGCKNNNAVIFAFYVDVLFLRGVESMLNEFSFLTDSHKCLKHNESSAGM